MLTSNFKDSKYYFEQLFATEWHDTPVHFVGTEFDAHGIEKWVNPFYTPIFGRPQGLGGITKNKGTLHVMVWAKNDVDAMELADNMVSFIAKHTKVNRYEIADHGWSDANTVFLQLSFDVEVFIGVCTAPPVQNYITIVHKGIPLTHNGIPIIKG